jgi:hypothetical protein
MKKAWTFLRAALLAGCLTLALQFPTTPYAEEGEKVQGTISRIDPVSGKVELQTEEGLMQFSLAPEDAEQFKVGDKVEVELGPEITPEEGSES